MVRLIVSVLQGSVRCVLTHRSLCVEQSIRSLKEKGEATGEDVTSTCISNTKNNLEKSLSDVDSCIQDLDYICGRLFNVEVTGTREDESGECDGSSSTIIPFVLSLRRPILSESLVSRLCPFASSYLLH